MSGNDDIHDRLAQAASDVTGSFHNWHARMQRFGMEPETQGGKWFSQLVTDIDGLDAVLAELDLMEGR